MLLSVLNKLGVNRFGLGGCWLLEFVALRFLYGGKLLRGLHGSMATFISVKSSEFSSWEFQNRMNCSQEKLHQLDYYGDSISTTT